MDLPIILYLLPITSFFLHSFPLSDLVHLLHQFILISLLILLSLVEFFLCYIFEHIRRFHVLCLLLFGRVGRTSDGHLLEIVTFVSNTELLAIRGDHSRVVDMTSSIVDRCFLDSTVVL